MLPSKPRREALTREETDFCIRMNTRRGRMFRSVAELDYAVMLFKQGLTDLIISKRLNDRAFMLRDQEQKRASR